MRGPKTCDELGVGHSQPYLFWKSLKQQANAAAIGHNVENCQRLLQFPHSKLQQEADEGALWISTIALNRASQYTFESPSRDRLHKRYGGFTRVVRNFFFLLYQESELSC